MPNSESMGLIQIEKLIDKGEHEEALLLIKDFEEKGEESLEDIVSFHLLKCKLFFQQGLFKKVVKFGQETYKESLGLGKSLLSIDALIRIAAALSELHEHENEFNTIKQGEALLKTLKRDLHKNYEKSEASIHYAKAQYYEKIRNIDLALEHSERSLVLREKFGAKQEVVSSLLQFGWIIGVHKAELDSGLEFIKQSITIARENNIKFYLGKGLDFIGCLYGFKGEIDLAISNFEQSIKIFKELNNKSRMAGVLNNVGENYRKRGELDRALDCLKQSLTLYDEVGDLKRYAGIYDFLIQVLIEKGDFEHAHQRLKKLEELKNLIEDKGIDYSYLLNKAMLLKTSLRAHNRVKAEEILKLLLEDYEIDKYSTNKVLFNLCELLLIELQITKDLEVLEELESYIAQLIESAEKSNSFWILGETYLLQAKLALISLDLKKARQLLTQGQQIAEKNGLKLLAMKISNEHDIVIRQLNIWENLKNSDSSLEERIELARLDEEINLIAKKKITTQDEFEIEQSILLAIVSKKGNILFSNPFTADMTFDVNRIAELLSSFNILSDEIFSEALDRVKFLDFTLLMKEVKTLIICYMFKGRTYGALQKLSHFCETLKNNVEILETLNSGVKKTQVMTLNDIPKIEELISESFLSDPQKFQVPFKAYEGEEPYLFVSYAHVDKLHVYPIIDYLNKANIKIWYDEGIPISENWRKIIVENIEKCNAFLVFITPHILDSDYVQKEINFALIRHKAFFAVYLKETKLPSELEFEISSIQHIKKYLMPESKFYEKLTTKLSFLLISKCE
ncbi:MAG: TIR domain-containing protein [Promethearchaeota archaeon]|nr:MAG: TIR domain-containing protein [Candidatus Lokiarchaeota archaeon]